MLTTTPLAIIGWQWIAIIVVVLLLFGGKKIPELMKGIGKGMKEFKNGMKEADAELQAIKKEIESDDDKK